MEGRVPGGQNSEEINGDLPYIDSNQYSLTTHDTDASKQGSKSLPRYAGQSDGSKYKPLEPHKSKTLGGMDTGRKGKLPSSLSLATLVRNMKKLSNLSINNSPKPAKRSKSLGRSKSLSRKNNEITTDKETKKVNAGIVCFEGDKIPGLAGLKNHGNTCFMNAVIQCLSNTELLTEYFVTDQYKQDIRGKSKYNAKKYGTKGELTQNVARLIKSLWMRQYSPSVSSDLKAIVGKYGPQYRGYSQHDAQEFLLWLLDKIHEDLNIAPKKKYKNSKVIHGRTDDTAAAEVLANHTRCNNSYVYDLFQALYKSSLTCPHCLKQSNTFDPFLSVSLPIPQRSKKAIYVTVVYLDAHPKQVRIGLLQDPGDTVRELRQALSCDTNIPQQQLILSEIYYDGFHRTFNDSQPLSDLHETDNIYAIEASPPLDEEDTDGGGVETEAGYITLVLLNKLLNQNNSQSRRFGGPFIIQVPREISFMELQEEILHNMSTMLREGFLEQGEHKQAVFFKLKVIDGMQGNNYLTSDVEHPLFTEYVERALSICVPGGGPEHVKLLVEWDPQTKQGVIANSDDSIEEHSSVKQAKQQSQRPVTGTLDECFKTYTQEERLECDNLWYCSNCRLKQQGTTKAISLWSLPDILVIHLKRFRQTSVNRAKVDTLITFPLTGLDMSQHVAKKPSTGQPNNKGMTGWSPWRPNRKAPSSQEDYIYDLYSVCNHYGNMQGGHYTAFCKSPATGKWHTYDDLKVTEMPDTEVNSRAAYLLFYHRRTAATMTVYDPEHWLHTVSKIKFIEPQTRHSQSHEDLLDDEDTEAGSEGHFSRNSNPYATLRSPTRNSPPRFISPTASDSMSSALVGSPSMGSLGLVDMCSEPTRKVRHDSQSTNHSCTPPTAKHGNQKPVMSPKPAVSPKPVMSPKPVVSPKPDMSSKFVHHIHGNRYGQDKEDLSSYIIDYNLKSAPRATPESFDCSRSPSLTHSHDSPQIKSHHHGVHKHYNEMRGYRVGTSHRDVYNGVGADQNGIESSDDSIISMENALNEQKLVSILDNNAILNSSNQNSASRGSPILAPTTRIRRQLPKTPPMKSALEHSHHYETASLPRYQHSTNHAHHSNLIHHDDEFNNHRAHHHHNNHHPHHEVNQPQQSNGLHSDHHSHYNPISQNQVLTSEDKQQQHGDQTAAGVDRTQDEHFRTVRRDKEKTPERELKKWDYKQTVYLQESCV